jgi:hypothetical protein
MDNIELMEIFNSSNDLVEELASIRFLNPLVLHNEIEQLSTTGVLHNQVELLGRFNYLYSIDC